MLIYICARRQMHAAWPTSKSRSDNSFLNFLFYFLATSARSHRWRHVELFPTRPRQLLLDLVHEKARTRRIRGLPLPQLRSWKDPGRPPEEECTVKLFWEDSLVNTMWKVNKLQNSIKKGILCMWTIMYLKMGKFSYELKSWRFTSGTHWRMIIKSTETIKHNNLTFIRHTSLFQGKRGLGWNLNAILFVIFVP